MLALGFAPALASGEVFRWVDELGVTHFTTDRDAIPSSYRDEAIEIGKLPSPAPRRAAPAPAPVPEASAPPESPPQARAPETSAPPTAEPAAAPVESAWPAPDIAPAPTAARATPPPPDAPATPEAPATPALAAPPAFPGPPPRTALPPDDPRASEAAELEAQIASDREKLRQMISTKRWDSAELASDPEIREIAERLPRLQAQLAALQAEPAP